VLVSLITQRSQVQIPRYKVKHQDRGGFRRDPEAASGRLLAPVSNCRQDRADAAARVVPFERKRRTAKGCGTRSSVTSWPLTQRSGPRRLVRAPGPIPGSLVPAFRTDRVALPRAARSRPADCFNPASHPNGPSTRRMRRRMRSRSASLRPAARGVLVANQVLRHETLQAGAFRNDITD
jgi:hypothetical protein